MLRIMDLASTSRRMERPEQSSRHSLIPESWFSARFFNLNRFSATANVSRPVRSQQQTNAQPEFHPNALQNFPLLRTTGEFALSAGFPPPSAPMPSASGYS